MTGATHLSPCRCGGQSGLSHAGGEFWGFCAECGKTGPSGSKLFAITGWNRLSGSPEPDWDRGMVPNPAAVNAIGNLSHYAQIADAEYAARKEGEWMTPEQIAILRDAVDEFDPESDNPNSLLIGTGLAPYDLAMEILSRAEVYGVAA